MSDSDTTRNLAPSLVAQLKGLGYVVTPEVDFERVKDGRLAKTLLRFEVVRMDGSCFVNAYGSEPKTPTTRFFRWETHDDSLPCAESLKLAIAAFAAAHPPAHPTLAAVDAGAWFDGGALADAEPTAAPRFVLDPVFVGGADTPDAGAIAVPKPKKSGCGCQSPGLGVALFGLAATIAFRRKRQS
jgi:hypothetical protein